MPSYESVILGDLELNGAFNEWRNLVPNPSAELSAVAGGMVAGNATLERSTAQAQSGSASFQVTANAAGNITLTNDGTRWAAKPGQAFSVAAEFRAFDTPRDCNVYVDFRDAGGIRVALLGGPTVAHWSGGWTRAVGNNLVAPAGTAFGQIVAQISNVPLGEVHYIDALIAVEDTLVPVYFDGDTTTPTHTWTGDTRNSVSSGTSAYALESFVVSPARKKPEWVSGGDSNGAVLGREALYENRVVTGRVRIKQQASMDAALTAVGVLVDRLQEAERGGIDVVWRPANSTRRGTLKVLMGEVDSLPVVVQGDDGGWFVKGPVVEFSLTCRPGIRLAEVTGPTATSTEPVVTLELSGVTGDLPADGRLELQDNATQSRRYFDWGLESLFYPKSSPPALLVDSDALVTTGFAGFGATRAGNYASGVLRVTLATQPVAVCGMGSLAHVGTFRVKARVYAVTAAAENVSVQLSWQDGDGPMRQNGYRSPVVANGWSEVDLGTIRVDPKYAGTQRWSGRIEAFSSIVGDQLDVDFVRLVPAAEGHGFGRAALIPRPGVLAGRDEFTGLATGTALNARVAPLGGTWATSGASTDITAADGPASGQESMSRSVVSDTGSGRVAHLDAGSGYTNIDVGLSVTHNINVDTVDLVVATITQAVIARYVDPDNWFELAVVHTVDGAVGGGVGGPELTYELQAVSRVAGVSSVVASTFMGSPVGDLKLTVTASGNFTATFGTYSLSGSRAELAPGGALASGKTGFRDKGPASSTPTGARYYDTFYAATPPAEPIVIHSGRSAEVTQDGARRIDSTGAYWGNVPAYRGSYFRVPTAGHTGRKARVAVRVARNDLVVAADDNITDSVTVRTFYTPVHLVVPD